MSHGGGRIFRRGVRIATLQTRLILGQFMKAERVCRIRARNPNRGQGLSRGQFVPIAGRLIAW